MGFEDLTLGGGEYEDDSHESGPKLKSKGGIDLGFDTV